MDYHRIYNQLIERALLREDIPSYYENHHIYPRCFGGSDRKENKVKLPYREHFIAHWLLCKIFPNEERMRAAFSAMLPRGKSRKGKNFEIKQYMRDAVSRNLKGVYYSWLKEHMDKYGPWSKGKKLGPAWNKGLKTGPLPNVHKAKISDTLVERYLNQPHHFKGVDPWNKGLSNLPPAWNFGIPADKRPCKHCGIMVDDMNMQKWHGDNCTKNPAYVAEEDSHRKESTLMKQRPVYAYLEDGSFVGKFDSRYEASLTTGCKSGIIGQVAKGVVNKTRSTTDRKWYKFSDVPLDA